MDLLMLHPELNLPTSPWHRWAVADVFQMDIEGVYRVHRLILKREQVAEMVTLGLSSELSHQLTLFP